MDSLWGALWRKWLDPGGFSTGLPSGPSGVDHLCGHLRRDIGLTEAEPGLPAPESIRDRKFSDPRTFCSLQAYR